MDCDAHARFMRKTIPSAGVVTVGGVEMEASGITVDVHVCEGFIRDRDRHWLVAIRFADLVARHNGRMKVDRLSPPGDGRPGGWRLEAFINSDVDVAAPSTEDETYQLCELIACRWMQRMNDRPRDDWKAPDNADNACDTCNVLGGQPCTPMHEGERDAGSGWSHPARTTAVRDSEVIRWARRVKRGDQRHVWPGLEATANMSASQRALVQTAVNQVVDEILALFDINERLIQARDKATQSYSNSDAAERIAAREVRRMQGARVAFDFVGLLGIGDEVELVNDRTVRRAHRPGIGRVYSINYVQGDDGLQSNTCVVVTRAGFITPWSGEPPQIT